MSSTVQAQRAAASRYAIRVPECQPELSEWGPARAPECCPSLSGFAAYSDPTCRGEPDPRMGPCCVRGTECQTAPPQLLVPPSPAAFQSSASHRRLWRLPQHPRAQPSLLTNVSPARRAQRRPARIGTTALREAPSASAGISRTKSRRQRKQQRRQRRRQTPLKRRPRLRQRSLPRQSRKLRRSPFRNQSQTHARS